MIFKAKIHHGFWTKFVNIGHSEGWISTLTLYFLTCFILQDNFPPFFSFCRPILCLEYSRLLKYEISLDFIDWKFGTISSNCVIINKSSYLVVVLVLTCRRLNLADAVTSSAYKLLNFTLKYQKTKPATKITPVFLLSVLEKRALFFFYFRYRISKVARISIHHYETNEKIKQSLLGKSFWKRNYFQLFRLLGQILMSARLK